MGDKDVKDIKSKQIPGGLDPDFTEKDTESMETSLKNDEKEAHKDFVCHDCYNVVTKEDLVEDREDLIICKNCKDMYNCECGRKVICNGCGQVFCRRRGTIFCQTFDTPHGLCERCEIKKRTFECDCPICNDDNNTDNVDTQ